MRKWMKVVIGGVVLGSIGYGAFTFLSGSHAVATTTPASNYAVVSLDSGTISQSVVSTGSLAMKATTDVAAPMDIVVADILVQAGDAVAKGDAVLSVDTAALRDEINALLDALALQDATIASLAGQYKETYSLKSPVEGRVKAIYVEQGAFLQASAADKPAMMLLSLDSLMKAVFSGVAALSPDDAVQVASGGTTYTGTISHIEADSVTVTFSDKKVLPGDEVQLVSDGTVLGTGTAQINMPYSYRVEDDGYISSISATINGSVEKNATLLTLKRSAQSRAYEQAVSTRQNLVDSLTKARLLLSDPMLYAPQDGIVASIGSIAGNPLAEGEAAVTLYTGDVMEIAISVDELDIIHVKAGQSASLTMDALPDMAYQAEVSRISQVGTTSSGVTNYTVTLDLAKDEQLKIGMNGTATIVVGEESGLLVPLQALQSDAKGTYLWLYQEGLEQTAAEPGVKTYITTSLSNADYAVANGLPQGSQVMVVRSSAKAISTQQDSAGAFDGQMPFSGTPPEGIMPQGAPMTRDGSTRPGGN